MARVLVILPTGSYRAADYVEAAAHLGVELALASEEAPPLGLEDRFVAIDCTDVERSAQAIAELAAHTPIDAIVSADDAGVVIAARSSELIGLEHNTPDSARATVDKALMRQRLAAGEVPQPEFAIGADVETLAGHADRIGYPVVVKPTNLSASRGVIRADHADGVRAAMTRITETFRDEIAAAGDRLLVERFIPGREITVEGLIWEGELQVLTVLDKPDPLDGPFFQETMFVAPTDLDDATVSEVERVTGAAVRAAGLGHGPVHAELRIEDGRPMVIEIAARTIGGLCGRSLTFGLMGESLETLVLRHALGRRGTGFVRTPQASGAMMLPIPNPGTLRTVEGVERAAAVPHIWSVEITAAIGSHLAPPPDGDRYLGFVFARAPTRREVIGALRGAAATIEVEVI